MKKVVNEALKRDLLKEAKDAKGNEKNRIKRFWSRYKTLRITGPFRQWLMRWKIWRLPSELWSKVYNTGRWIVTIGKREHESLKIDLQKLVRATGDGNIKTGKQYNNAKNAILKKHGYRRLPSLEAVALDISKSACSVLESRRLYNEAKKEEPSVGKAVAKGAAIGAGVGVAAKTARRVQLMKKGGKYAKTMQRAADGIVGAQGKAAEKAVDAGKGFGATMKDTVRAGNKSRGMKLAKGTAGKLKHGGKWGRIGAGVGAVGLGAAAALKARRASKNK